GTPPAASQPAPDEQFAAIPAAPELATDVPARQPDGPVPDPAKQGLTRSLDDPHILERHEVIGIVRGHGNCSFRSPRRAHVRRERARAWIAWRGCKRAHLGVYRTRDEGGRRRHAGTQGGRAPNADRPC